MEKKPNQFLARKFAIEELKTNEEDSQ